MRKSNLKMRGAIFSALSSLLLFFCLFLFAGTGQGLAQVSTAAVAASPYGGKTFVASPVAIQLLQAKLPIHYSQLASLAPGTKQHKRKELEILCYKGAISDIAGGTSVMTAYENNLAILAIALNQEESDDLSFLRGVHSELFNMLTN